MLHTVTSIAFDKAFLDTKLTIVREEMAEIEEENTTTQEEREAQEKAEKQREDEEQAGKRKRSAKQLRIDAHKRASLALQVAAATRGC